MLYFPVTFGIFNDVFLLGIFLSFVLHGPIDFPLVGSFHLEHLKCQYSSEFQLWCSFSFYIFFPGWQYNTTLKSRQLQVREILNVSSATSCFVIVGNLTSPVPISLSVKMSYFLSSPIIFEVLKEILHKVLIIVLGT